MVYFLILPLYLVVLTGMLLAGVVLRFTRFKFVARYVLGAAWGSLPGFVVANGLLFLLLALVGRLQSAMSVPAASEGLSWSAIAAAATIFIGPFVASALGSLVGAVLGMATAWRTRS